MRYSPLFKHILLIIFKVSGTTSNFCSTVLNSGPYSLEIDHAEITVNSPVSIAFQKRQTVDTKAHGIVAYRAVWTSYCYQGGALDSNTGCLNKYELLPPDADEALEWRRKGKCKVGTEYTNAWGSDAQTCIADYNLNKWVDHQELTKRSSNNRFAYHTCNKSWRCGFHDIELPFVLTSNSTWILTPSGLKKYDEIMKYHKNAETVTYLTSAPKIVEDTILLNCSVSPNQREFACYDPKTNLHFTTKANSETCLKNACYSNGNPLYRDYLPFEGKTYWDSASISDVHQVVDYMKEQVYIQSSNNMILLHKIKHLETILTNVILSLAKIDDRLIGNLLGQPMKTQFLSPNSFLASPCLSKSAGSNCLGNQIYRDGRWIPNNDKSNCVNLKKTTAITLYDNLSLWLPELESVDVEGVSGNLEGWSFYASEKENLWNTMTYTKYGGQGTGLQDLSNWPSGALNNLKTSLSFGIAGSYIFIIVIVLFIYILIKKF